MIKNLSCPVCSNKKAEIKKAFVGNFYITDFISCRKCGLIKPLPSGMESFTKYFEKNEVEK